MIAHKPAATDDRITVSGGKVGGFAPGADKGAVPEAPRLRLVRPPR
jgi:hypothetical protein